MTNHDLDKKSSQPAEKIFDRTAPKLSDREAARKAWAERDLEKLDAFFQRAGYSLNEAIDTSIICYKTKPFDGIYARKVWADRNLEKLDAIFQRSGHSLNEAIDIAITVFL